MSWYRSLLTFFQDAFRPPFRTLPWIVALYVALTMVYNTDSSFNRWALPDTDDYMRLSQMLTWLNGQSWFDLHIPHLYPNHPIVMHWGRLPDLLLAGVFLVLQNIAAFFRWETNSQAIGMLTAFFVPMVLLILLLFLVRAVARPVLGRRKAGVVCFLVPLCTLLLFQFTPMRVDHHAYILLGATAAFYCLQAFALHVRPRQMMGVAGIAFALAMWNGAEIMPMLIFFCMALTVLIVLERKNYAAAALFGLSLLAANFIVLLISRAPDQRWSLEYDAFSFFYVLLAALVTVFFGLMFVASMITKNRTVMSAFAVFIGLCGIALLLQHFPDFIDGPYAKANPALNTLFFPNIREAIPLFKAAADVGDAFSTSPKQGMVNAINLITSRLFVSIAGISIAFYMIFFGRISTRQRRLWSLYGFFALAYAALAVAWEVRVITYAQLFAVIPLTALLLRGVASLPKHYQGRKLYAYEWLMVFLLTLFPVVVLPGMLQQAKLMPDIMFFLGKGVDAPCNNRMPIIAYFNDLYERKHTASTIMAPMDYTPELMFYTKDDYIAAPYHRNDRGIMDMIAFYRSKPTDNAAQDIAARLNLDYVVICKASFFQGTMRKENEVKNMTVTFNGNKTTYTPAPKDVAKGSLGIRLAYDKVPDWLERRDVPMDSEFALFEVKKNKLPALKNKPDKKVDAKK